MKQFIVLFSLFISTPLILLQSLPVFAQLNTTFVPLPTPCRIIDTRQSVAGRLIRDQPRNFNVVGPSTDYSDQGGTPAGCGIPGRVQAVVINLVAVNPVASGNMQIWPSDQARPTNPPASAINFSTQNAFPAIANGVIVPVSQNPQGPNITVLATRFVDLVADVYGYFPVFANVINVNELRSSNFDVDIRANQDVDVMIDNSDNSFLDAWSVYTNGSFVNNNKVAELNEQGNLKIRGTLTQQGNFDIAEIYKTDDSRNEEIMPGHVVSFTDPDTVELANRNNCSKALGPVSTDPGIVLGGAFLDEASLEKYGYAMMSKYQSKKKSLMQGSEYKSLFEAQNKEDNTNKQQEKEKAKIESLAMEIFVAENFVPVALAGKVPVKVLGPISAGDELSPGGSPEENNGVAKKSDGSCPTIGVAMENYPKEKPNGLPSDQIWVFVTRK